MYDRVKSSFGGAKMNLKVGESLAYHRVKRGFSRGQVAMKLGVSYGTYYQYEAETRVPDIYILAKLSEVYGVSIDELVGHDRHRMDEAKSVSEWARHYGMTRQRLMYWVDKLKVGHRQEDSSSPSGSVILLTRAEIDEIRQNMRSSNRVINRGGREWIE